MGRGSEPSVTCDACGRRVPRTKAVSDFKPIRYSTDLRSAQDVRYIGRREVHYCVSCGKSLGVYERLKRKRAQERERGR